MSTVSVGGPGSEVLGLPALKKSTPITFTADRRARMTLNLTLPVLDVLLGKAVTSSPLTITSENNAGVKIEAFSLSFGDIHLGVFILKNVSISYVDDGGSDLWTGSLTLVFPSPDGKVKATGGLVIRDGKFVSGDVHLQWPPPGIGPMGCCVWVYSFLGALSTSWVEAGATFGLGPNVFGNVRLAQATGTARIFYSPFLFGLKVSDVKILGIGVDAEGDVLITQGSFYLNAFFDHDWGPLGLDVKFFTTMGKKGWSATGGGAVCLDFQVEEACVGGYGGIGSGGVSGCGFLTSSIAGGVRLGWSFFTGNFGNWEFYTGCSFGKVKSKVSAAAMARLRRTLAASGSFLASAKVTVPKGLPSVLFEIPGEGEPPKVSLRAPGGRTYTASADYLEGSDHLVIRLPHDDTTYVAITNPKGGTWRVRELAGSAPMTSIGLARGLPKKLVTGKVTGTGRTRTLRYRVAGVPGLRVEFVERAGNAGPSQVLGRARHGRRAKIRFRPVEGKPRARRIEAVVYNDGSPMQTLTVARFKAPPQRRLPAPDVTARRKGAALVSSWSKVPGARSYRVLVEPSDGPSRTFDLRRTRLRLGGLLGPASSAVVRVGAMSPSGRPGKLGRAAVRGFPELVLARRARIPDVLRAKGWRARCTPVTTGDCEVEIVKGKRRLARGRVSVSLGGSRTFLVKLTGAGRRALRAAGGRLRVRALVALPGRPPQTRAVVLVRG